MSKHFTHSGAIGDVIYSLPAVRAMGGGVIHLVDSFSFQASYGMSSKWREVLAPLLEAQDYIQAVLFSEAPADAVNLNDFRRKPCGDIRTTWLPLQYLRANDLPDCLAKVPWLAVPKNPVAQGTAIIFSRSARYRNPNFPWKEVVEQHGQRALFVGTSGEHAAFNFEFQCDVPWLGTNNLLEAAEFIAECQLFVGNQSAPLAIAEGLKRPVVCETCSDCPNCLSPRPTFWDGRYSPVPDLEELIHG